MGGRIGGGIEETALIDRPAPDFEVTVYFEGKT